MTSSRFSSCSPHPENLFCFFLMSSGLLLCPCSRFAFTLSWSNPVFLSFTTCSQIYFLNIEFRKREACSFWQCFLKGNFCDVIFDIPGEFIFPFFSNSLATLFPNKENLEFNKTKFFNTFSYSLTLVSIISNIYTCHMITHISVYTYGHTQVAHW